jgi:HPr kinase/phosphorylase
MPATLKAKRPLVTVGKFYKDHGQALSLRLAGPAIGFDTVIREPTINRPGLAIAGFYTYFARKRIQVLGNSELSYLKSLEPAVMRTRIRDMCLQRIPCIIVARSAAVPKALVEEATAHGIAVFRTPMITMRFINAATIALESDFAPSVNIHGSMMDVQGMGVLICGSSGVGKSECVLALIERGYSLVSDDITILRAIEGRDLLATSPELTRHHMEVRGLGVINVSAIFGVGSIRVQKRLDLIVTLKDWQELEEVDRIGLDREWSEILGVKVPHVTIPVRVGRDLARLVEVAALDEKLKCLGHNSAVEFNQRLLQAMERKS